jgi:hypothetical protein
MADTEAKKNLAYRAGELSRLGTVPEWFQKAAAASEEIDWTEALANEGAERVEQFGEAGDTYTIYRTPDGGYLVEIHDVHYDVAWVFIDEVFDYLRFRIEWLKPLVELSDRADKQVREEIERRRQF